MTDNEIMSGLKEIISMIKPAINTETITPASRLTDDLRLDSLTIMLLSLAIENKFGFQFKGQSVFTTVGDVIDFIRKEGK